MKLIVPDKGQDLPSEAEVDLPTELHYSEEEVLVCSRLLSSV